MTPNLITIIPEVLSDIQTTKENMALYEVPNFIGRAEAIDFLDFHVIDRIEGLCRYTEPNEDLEILMRSAELLKDRLEKIDTKLFIQLREEIKMSADRQTTFLAIISEYLGDVDKQEQIGYDNTDSFFNSLIFEQPVPAPTMKTAPEMVFYQKTPARITLKMIEQARFGKHDVFVDIGCGLGQVVILANLAGGVTASGIEYEPAYCDYARAVSSRLNLSNIEFINADARNANYSNGTVFFMYTPFAGNMLQEVLDMLRNEARKRTIRLFTYGPCSAHVARQSWLYTTDGKADDPHTLYEFKSLQYPEDV